MKPGGQRAQRERKRLLAAVRQRCARFASRQDPGVVLDAAALAEVAALVDVTPDPASDLEVAHAAGWLHWCRYLVLDPGNYERDLTAALWWLAPVYQAHPDAVPGEVRAHFEKAGPPASHDDFEVIANQAAEHLQHALRARSGDELDGAIDLLGQALRAIPSEHPARAGALSNLCGALQARFEWTDRLADLDEAIRVGQESVAAIPPDHANHPTMLSNLGIALKARFDRTGRLADLDEVVGVRRRAAAATSPEHRKRAAYLSDLGSALQTRFKRTGQLADLDEAVTVTRQAVATASPEDTNRAKYLSNLGAALRARFEQTTRPADLDEGIGAMREALGATPPDRRRPAATLFDLGVALRIRFERTGQLADLHEAIRAGREAVAATPSEHADRPTMLYNLGAALQVRFDRTGGPADLEEAIRVTRAAVAAAPPGHAELPTMLSNHIAGLQARFEQTGEMKDLDEAIRVGREAVSAIPPDNAGRAHMLNNFGLALRSQFEQTGELASLDEAVRVGREAVAAAPPQHPDRAGLLSNLGTALKTRFDGTGALADLDEAIHVGREAMAAISAEHPDRAGILSNLGAALQSKFKETSRPEDLEDAIRIGQEAVAVCPPKHPGRPTVLSNVGSALSHRFERTGEPEDLEGAIRISREAVAAVAADHPDRARMLSNLGLSLQARFERTGEPADLDEAIEVHREAVGVEVAPPRMRAIAARGWGRVAAVGGRWQEAVDGFSAAVELLGLVAPRSLARGDQERLLEEFGGLASEAAACCVHTGRVDLAVELFEQGRGVLLGRALDTRTDLTALSERYPESAKRFIALRDELDHADDTAGQLVSVGRDHLVQGRRLNVARRRELSEEFERTIAEIRAQPEFGDFLRPRSLPELAGAAGDGPVILVSVSRFGSHALVLTRSGVEDPIPLDDLTPDSVADHVMEFLTAVHDMSAPVAAEQRVATVLLWLWDVLAGPVLDRLGISGPPAEDTPWPRVWWCLSGLMSFLPVHAAGHHDNTRGESTPATVIDRVISSYTPTIRALAHARRIGERDTAGPGDRSVVVVAMPHTPEATDLPGALDEATVLEQRFPDQVTVLTGPGDANYERVLRALRRARCVHFACHGLSDLANPSASHLLLDDHQQRPLTVVDVARQRLDNAGLAFLSACSTAQPGRLPDEAIHLASAFQLAGYRHVIATLWPIDDFEAVTVAEDVYLQFPDPTDPTIDAAAALHVATRRLRKRTAPTPSVWASHIHSGA